MEHIDFSNEFKRNHQIRRELYRFSEGHEDDKVHLGGEGNKILARVVQDLVNHSLDLRDGVQVEGKLLPPQETGIAQRRRFLEAPKLLYKS